MYLAEDHLCEKCDVNVMGPGFLYYALIDPMLGTGVSARRSMGSSLISCQMGVHRYGHTRSGAFRSVLECLSDLMFHSGPRIGLATSQMELRARILDSPRTHLPNFQSELLLGRPRAVSFYSIKLGFTF